MPCTFSNCIALFSGPNSVDSSKPSPCDRHHAALS
jgi:hypothetical protein